MADLVRGVVPFDMAGDGVVIHFKNSDLTALRLAVRNEKPDQPVDAWLEMIGLKAEVYDLEQLEVLLKHGAKKDGAPADINLDAIERPIYEIQTALLNGLSIAMFGRNIEEQHEYEQAELAKRKEAEARGDKSDPTQPVTEGS